jgi:hypothetical protein
VEFFQNTIRTVATTQRLNFSNTFKNIVSIRPEDWNYVLNRLSTNQPLTAYGKPEFIILDPIDYIENASYYANSQLDEGYFMIITSPDKKDDFKCGFDFNGKTIGYFDNPEKRFIDTLTYGYRTLAKKERISYDKIADLKVLWDRFDAIVIYLMPKSPLAKILASQDLLILDVGDISIDRLHFTNPYLIPTFISKNLLFEANNKIVFVKESISVLKMSLILVSLTYEETFVSRLKLSPEFTDPNYKCVGDESIKSNALCNSPFDIVGNPKNPTIADKPCVVDTECPFYKANKKYPNTRGGCITGGKCEMPVGVKRIGYTHYFDRGQYSPFCYGCGSDLDCCRTQKEPDFAFPNDKDERKTFGLSTYNRLSS